MKIETKFDIGQEIYFIGFFDFIDKGKIEKIEIRVNKDEKFIVYALRGFINTFCQSQIFATREEAEAKLKEMRDE